MRPLQRAPPAPLPLDGSPFCTWPWHDPASVCPLPVGVLTSAEPLIGASTRFCPCPHPGILLEGSPTLLPRVAPLRGLLRPLCCSLWHGPSGVESCSSFTSHSPPPPSELHGPLGMEVPPCVCFLKPCCAPGPFQTLCPESPMAVAPSRPSCSSFPSVPGSWRRSWVLTF